MKKIVIVDYYLVIRKGIVCMLKKLKDYFIVGKVNNGDEFFKYLEEINLDILIMEIDML